MNRATIVNDLYYFLYNIYEIILIRLKNKYTDKTG